jgi:hypothetical protein
MLDLQAVQKSNGFVLTQSRHAFYYTAKVTFSNDFAPA